MLTRTCAIVCRATSIEADGRDIVLLGDAAGRLSLVASTSNDGPSKPIMRNLGVVSLTLELAGARFVTADQLFLINAGLPR